MRIARKSWAASAPGAFPAGLLVVGVLAATLTGAAPSAAQSAASEPGADNLRAAANAYDKGSARYALKDYASAADWFELADRLAPDAAALQSAIRAHRQAGAPAHLARGATLALNLRARYPNDRAAVRLADDVIASAAPSMARITVRCEDCRIEIDGAPEPGRDVFVPPGDHRLVTHLAGGREASRALDARAGKTEVVDIAAAASARANAPSDVAPAAAVPTTTPGAESRPTVREPSRGLSPAFAIGGAVLTAALAGATAVSWFGDALPEGRRLVRDARATHRPDPDQEDRVSAAETRTSILLGASAATAVATIVLSLVFTRWRGDDAVTAASLAGGRGAFLRARF